MKILSFILSASLFSLVSCSTTFTEQQKQQLASLDIQKPILTDQSYTEPQGNKDLKIARKTAFVGLTGATLGFLLEEGIEANQQAKFNKQYGEAAAQVYTSVPKMLSTDLQKKTKTAVNTIPQLNGKLNPSSSNKLITNITSYGFKRVGKAGDKILMTPQIKGTYSLTLDGKEIVKPTKIESQAHPEDLGQHEITAYLSNKPLAMKDFEKASEEFAKAIRSKLEEKYQN